MIISFHRGGSGNTERLLTCPVTQLVIGQSSGLSPSTLVPESSSPLPHSPSSPWSFLCWAPEALCWIYSATFMTYCDC